MLEFYGETHRHTDGSWHAEVCQCGSGEILETTDDFPSRRKAVSVANELAALRDGHIKNWCGDRE